MNEETKKLLNKCDNCKLKVCITCEFTYTDIQKIKKYVKQKESILNKVTDKLKEDIEKYNKEIIRDNTLSIASTNLAARVLQSQKILNIIEGEKK